MRSVLTFLPDCTLDRVGDHLGITIPCGCNPTPHLQHIADIRHYSSEEAALEMPEIYAGIAERLGQVRLGVIVDISGRVDGTAEATSLCTGLLRRFGGVALDDYSDHLWTLDELLSGATFRGHHFFDTAGWHRESQSESERTPQS